MGGVVWGIGMALQEEIVNPLGAKGLGEIGVAGVAAAIANAVHHATGRRVRHLPITLDALLWGPGRSSVERPRTGVGPNGENRGTNGPSPSGPLPRAPSPKGRGPRCTSDTPVCNAFRIGERVQKQYVALVAFRRGAGCEM
jgi:hypothetical protein